MHTCFEPISLGSHCSEKFQLVRTLYLRSHPEGSLGRLRRAIRSRQASKIFTRLPFDSQITPTPALLAYLERDFGGVFEREDLMVDERGVVMHRDLLTQHPHEFHPVDGRMDQAVIDAQYPAARAKFDHLAGKFRRLLDQPGPFLYVRGPVPCRSDAIRLIQLLSARGPHHRFRLLFVGEELRPDLEGIDERISQNLVAPAADKDPDIQWEGDDASWDRVLQDFDLGLPRGPAFTANFNVVEDFSDRPQQDLILEWSLLPEVAPATDLPRTFDVPGTAWAFAAQSEPIDALAATAPKTLILKVEALQGHVGVGLMRADGKAMIGREYWLSPQDGLFQIALPLAAGLEPARIVLRNHGHADISGAVRLHGVSLAD